MDSADAEKAAAEQMELCRRACFNASAMGLNCVVEEKEGMTKYVFRSMIGTVIEGQFYPDKKSALESLCINFNASTQNNGKH